jgi:glucose/arabinose dehydrogenase
MMRALSLTAALSSAALLGALGCSSEELGHRPADPDAVGGEGAGGTPGIPTNPSTLRVEFEELSLETEPAFLTDFVFYPGSDTDFLALDKSGKLLRFELGETGATLLSTAQVARVYDVLDCGALSLAFEPDFEEGNFVYVGTCVSQTHSEVLRLDLDEDLNPVSGTDVTIINVGHAQSTRPWHNVGSIGFEPGGVMWAIFGDKVRGAPSQDQAENLGKLLRILPSREPGLGGFEPAPDGPLVDNEEAAQAVFALGLRSPFRGTRDSRGFYWIGDVGSDFYEEINVVTGPLDNFGWPDFEGPCEECGDMLPPAFYWNRKGETPDYVVDDAEIETTFARVAWAGPEIVASDSERYNGRLVGSVLFGDFCGGFIRQGRVDDFGVPTLDSHLGHLNNASAFRQHTDGYVYAITFGRCQTDVDNQADEPFSRLYRMVQAED